MLFAASAVCVGGGDPLCPLVPLFPYLILTERVSEDRSRRRQANATLVPFLASPEPSQEEEEVEDAAADGQRPQEGQPRLRLVREDERPPARHGRLHLGREAAPLGRGRGHVGGKGQTKKGMQKRRKWGERTDRERKEGEREERVIENGKKVKEREVEKVKKGRKEKC